MRRRRRPPTANLTPTGLRFQLAQFLGQFLSLFNCLTKTKARFLSGLSGEQVLSFGGSRHGGLAFAQSRSGLVLGRARDGDRQFDFPIVLG